MTSASEGRGITTDNIAIMRINSVELVFESILGNSLVILGKDCKLRTSSPCKRAPLEEAANWMDNIKDDHSYDYMKPWHYANFGDGQPVAILQGANIMFQLEQTLKTLEHKDTLTKAEIKLKILYLFHLIGDLHQPLHVGYGHDKGGNTVQLNYKGKGKNLHSFWDSGIIYYQNITLTDCLKAQNYSAVEVKDLQKIDLITWGNDSRSLLGAVYDYKKAKVSDEYVAQSGLLIEKQIQKAGIRLAGVLEKFFK